MAEETAAATTTTTTTTPAATPTATPAATQTAAAVTTPPMVPLTVEEYQRLRGLEREASEARAEQARRVEEAERQKSLAIAAKEGAEKGLEAERSRYEGKLSEAQKSFADLERQYLGEKKSVAVAAGLDGVKFVSAAAAAQVRQLLEPRFAAARDASGQIAVRDVTTGRPAADVIKEAFASGEYDHFLDPASRGGAGAGDTTRAESPAVVNGGKVAQQLRDSIERARSGAAPGLAGTYGGRN